MFLRKKIVLQGSTWLVPLVGRENVMVVASTVTGMGATIEDVNFAFQKNRGQPVQSTGHGFEIFPFIRCCIIILILHKSSFA
jgi:hypothetical protein